MLEGDWPGASLLLLALAVAAAADADQGGEGHRHREASLSPPFHCCNLRSQIQLSCFWLTKARECAGHGLVRREARWVEDLRKGHEMGHFVPLQGVLK